MNSRNSLTALGLTGSRGNFPRKELWQEVYIARQTDSSQDIAHKTANRQTAKHSYAQVQKGKNGAISVRIVIYKQPPLIHTSLAVTSVVIRIGHAFDENLVDRSDAPTVPVQM